MNDRDYDQALAREAWDDFLEDTDARLDARWRFDVLLDPCPSKLLAPAGAPVTARGERPLHHAPTPDEARVYARLYEGRVHPFDKNAPARVTSPGA